MVGKSAESGGIAKNGAKLGNFYKIEVKLLLLLVPKFQNLLFYVVDHLAQEITECVEEPTVLDSYGHGPILVFQSWEVPKQQAY